MYLRAMPCCAMLFVRCRSTLSSELGEAYAQKHECADVGFWARSRASRTRVRCQPAVLEQQLRCASAQIAGDAEHEVDRFICSHGARCVQCCKTPPIRSRALDVPQRAIRSLVGLRTPSSRVPQCDAIRVLHERRMRMLAIRIAAYAPAVNLHSASIRRRCWCECSRTWLRLDHVPPEIHQWHGGEE